MDWKEPKPLERVQDPELSAQMTLGCCHRALSRIWAKGLSHMFKKPEGPCAFPFYRWDTGGYSSSPPSFKPLHLLLQEGHELWALRSLLHWPLHLSAPCLGLPPTCSLLALGGEHSLCHPEGVYTNHLRRFCLDPDPLTSSISLYLLCLLTESRNRGPNPTSRGISTPQRSQFLNDSKSPDVSCHWK